MGEFPLLGIALLGLLFFGGWFLVTLVNAALRSPYGHDDDPPCLLILFGMAVAVVIVGVFIALVWIITGHSPV